MRTFILIALGLSIGFLAAHPAVADDKKPATGSDLVMVDGCLMLSVGDYVLLDDNGITHNLTGTTAKLHRFVSHRVEIIGQDTIETFDTTQMNIASSADQVPAIRVQSGHPIGGKCGR